MGTGPVGRKLGVLGRSQALTLLLGARAVSVGGDAATQAALLIHVATTMGSGVAVGFLLLAGSLPRLCSPVAGAIADRVEQRRLLLGCEAGQAAILLAMAVLPPFPLLLGLVFARASLATLFHPAGRSCVRELVADPDLPAANGLLGAGVHGSAAVGPAVAALLLPYVGAPGVLVLDAGTSLCAVALLLRLPRLPPSPIPDGDRRSTLLADTRDGLSYVRGHRVARAYAAGLLILVAFAGMDLVAIPFLAESELDNAEGTGYLIAAAAAGLLVGSLGFARLGRAGSTARWLVGAFALQGLGLTLAAWSPTLTFALVVLLLAGVGNGVELGAGDTLLQRTVPRRMLGRAFGTVYGLAFVGEVIAFSVGGPLLDTAGPRVTIAVAGGGALAASGVLLGLLRTR